MAKVKVIEVFRDIYTNEIYKKGDVLEVTKKRAEEMGHFVEKVKEEVDN